MTDLQISPSDEQSLEQHRAEREGADEALLARHDAEPSLEPSILSIRPVPGSAVPGRLERDIDVIRGGLEAGRLAVLQALGAVL